ncbi:MAG: preprotein translocase subunit SecG [Gammaproteobacteria bacterium]
MYGILIVIHLIVAIALIGFILLQHGKGAQTGAAFGSGASTTVFGSQGSGNFLSRTTALLATVFFILNLALGYLMNKSMRPEPLQPLKQLEEQVLPSEAPAKPAVPTENGLPE